MIAPQMGILFEAPLQLAGAMTLLTGPGNDLGQLSIIQDLDITTLVGVPSYILHLVQATEQIPESVQRIITLGKPLSKTVRKRIEVGWNAEVFDDYENVELGAVFLECEEHKGHVMWNKFFIETIDPKIGQPTENEEKLSSLP